MMRIDIISAVPQLLESPLEESIIGKARENDLVEIGIHDLRDFSNDKHNKVDDYAYGPGAGMVLTPQPIFDCVNHLKNERVYDAVVFPAPDARPYKQKDANELSLAKNVMIVCGHYKGVDQRVREALITHEYSLGDFVLSGGEIPGVAMIDSIVRLLPEAIGDSESALTDSFQSGFLEAPVYTRPAEFEGMIVPEVLRSGDHKKIEQWRRKKSIEKTKEIRPDLIEKLEEKEH